MAGGERRAAEPVGELEHRVEAHVTVAAHARVRGLPRRVAVDERLTTPARNSSRRSIVKCGSSIAWASARAWATAVAEQQLRSASFSRSAHSSSVTAAVGPAAAHRCATTALSTPPLIATSVRGSPVCGAGTTPRAFTACPSARASASAASSAACSLPGLRPPSSSAISVVPIRAASRIGVPRTSVDGGAAGRVRRAAAVGVEAGVGDRVAVDLDAERDLVTAGAAAAGDREPVVGDVAPALGRGQVVLEGVEIHRRSQLTARRVVRCIGIVA